MNVRDRKDVVTGYPKEKIAKFSKLTWVYPWFPKVTDLPQSKDITSSIGGDSVYGCIGILEVHQELQILYA